MVRIMMIEASVLPGCFALGIVLGVLITLLAVAANSVQKKD